MKKIFLNANVFIDGVFKKIDFSVENNNFFILSDSALKTDSLLFDLKGAFVFPGFVDVHVHFRDPGFLYKEDIKSGTLAAAHGGFTSVCAMPNLTPVPDTIDNLKIELDAIKEKAVINVYPYASITKEEKGKYLSDIKNLSEFAVAFSDDGKGVQNENVMLNAMIEAKKYNKIIAAHCENESTLNGGYIHDGDYAKKYAHIGISSESEYSHIKRDLDLALKTGVKYHACHVSCKESVELIKKAKCKGVNVSCETAPHYLVLNDSMLQDDGRFKMNPPIRSEQDRLALIEGIQDGIIDMIATDHAPHSAEEKNKGLKDSLMGVVGLETAFPILYTELVKKDIISREKLIELMSLNPSKRFNIGSNIKNGCKADFTVFDLNKNYIINSKDFLSKGRSTPFEGRKVFGKCLMTVVNGNIVYKDKEVKNVQR